jgi:hypothetical protein
LLGWDEQRCAGLTDLQQWMFHLQLHTVAAGVVQVPAG